MLSGGVLLCVKMVGLVALLRNPESYPTRP